MTTSSTRTELQERAKSMLLQYAVFRWENGGDRGAAVDGALPAAGAALADLGLGDSGGDRRGCHRLLQPHRPRRQCKIPVDLMQEEFNPLQIRDQKLRDEVNRGLEYQWRIEQAVQGQRPGLMRDRLENTAGQLSDWVSNVFQLALRLDAYLQDSLLRQERQNVPQEIEQIAARVNAERNPEIRFQVEEVLDGKRKQLAALQRWTPA
ncbi:MAG: hypothetical protein R2856_04420 [Caldilineaceae bacterium]